MVLSGSRKIWLAFHYVPWKIDNDQTDPYQDPGFLVGSPRGCLAVSMFPRFWTFSRYSLFTVSKGSFRAFSICASGCSEDARMFVSRIPDSSLGDQTCGAVSAKVTLIAVRFPFFHNRSDRRPTFWVNRQLHWQFIWITTWQRSVCHYYTCKENSV